MEKKPVGRPRSDRMTEAVRRVIDGGEVALQVAHSMGIKNAQQLYRALRFERARRQQSD